MKKRLQNILAHAGIASRRKAAELIESGKVSIDGRTVTEKGIRIDPAEHKISVSGKVIPTEEKKYYFLFNKPAGVISTVSDTHGRNKVMDYFKDIDARLYPVGRLDKDTTGALLITNDGDLANRLAHPRFEIEKEYVVTIRGAITRSDMRRMERGVEIDGKRTSPCKMRLIKRIEPGPGMVFTIRLHEGRKRQIKRMFEELGKRVTALKRTRYAGLTLTGLKEGQWRELTGEEVGRLLSFRARPKAESRNLKK